METKTQNLITKPPVVVVMGHVDSGKTSILDQIRKTHVAEKESGGITQHIGAYQIEKDNKKITFIDTPGHEAFSAMRARGARVADIAVLVVDATQGVQSQTKEAILQAKKAEIPIIVALNKIDNPAANPQKIKQELSKEGVLVESLGGKALSIDTSAKTGQGIDELLELILLTAEMAELSADNSRPAQGVVIESHLDGQKGLLVSIITEEGTLKPGLILATASAFGKIKRLENFQGENIETALAGDPVIVSGFEKMPKVGENFNVFLDIEAAQDYVAKEREKIVMPESAEATQNKTILNLVLKTDCLGSKEAIEEILKGLPQEKVVLRILKSEPGDINDSDVKLAKSAPAKIIGFRVKTSKVAEGISQREKIRIANFEIIYELVEKIRSFMEKILEPEIVRIDLGKVKILALFLTGKNRQVLGGRILEGEIEKGSKVDVWRNEEMLGQGKIINLQKNKKDADIVQEGDECGILFEGNVKIAKDDILLAFKEEGRKGEL